MPEAGWNKLSPAEWDSLVDQALRFSVGGLLYREIKSRNFPAEYFPGDARNRLREAYRSQATNNTILFGNAAKVLASLADNQLPVIALKGLAVAKSLYGDIALRPMSDLDLFVKEDDLVRAGRILLAIGYTQPLPAWESMVRTFHHLPPFTNKSGVIIELHWNIVPPDSSIKMDLEGLWQRARLVKLSGVEARAFSPEDQFLHLCIHACLHLQAGLGLLPICDIAAMINISDAEIDWRIVIARATRWGVQKCVYLMLLLVRELLGVAPPENVIVDLKPDDYQPAFFAEAQKQILDEQPSSQLTRRRCGEFLKLKKAKGIKGRFIAIAKGAFPSKAYLAHYYPVAVSSPKIYLYYILRLGRLFGYYAWMLVRIFLRDRSLIKAVGHGQRVRAVSDWLFS